MLTIENRKLDLLKSLRPICENPLGLSVFIDDLFHLISSQSGPIIDNEAIAKATALIVTTSWDFLKSDPIVYTFSSFDSRYSLITSDSFKQCDYLPSYHAEYGRIASIVLKSDFYLRFQSLFADYEDRVFHAPLVGLPAFDFFTYGPDLSEALRAESSSSLLFEVSLEPDLKYLFSAFLAYVIACFAEENTLTLRLFLHRLGVSKFLFDIPRPVPDCVLHAYPSVLGLKDMSDYPAISAYLKEFKGRYHCDSRSLDPRVADEFRHFLSSSLSRC